MSKLNNPFIQDGRRYGRIYSFAAVLVVLILGLNSFGSKRSIAQTVIVSSPSVFRVGEKLSYSISFGKIPDAGYAETHVVSRGKISGKDAVEIRSRVKTIDIVSAAFFQFDESRTVFAAPDTGLPLYISSNSHDGALPKETVNNYLAQSTSNFDLLTLIYKLRESGGIGTFPLFEGEQVYTVSFQGLAQEKVKTEAGDFDTTVSTVQSDFLTATGIKELKINFSSDEYRVPVMIRFKISKGDFKLVLSAIALPEPELPSPSPTPISSPRPTVAPKSSPTPAPYVENQPLAAELGFQIGELLDYRITAGGKPVGILSLNARERKLFEKMDSLLLTATITGVEPGSNGVRLGDGAKVQVDPDTLTPTRLDTKFASSIVGLNQTLNFDNRTGAISFGGEKPLDSPIGTHSFLSLIYAMRSFNLKPSKDLNNPVNDTRVAVFWESKSYVFTLRPSNPEEIEVNGQKVSAQMISINTNNQALDALALRVWLSTEERVPLRFSAGEFQADLISRTSTLSR